MNLADRRAVGARLRAERKSRGWTVREMARRLAPHVTEQCPDLDTLISYVKRWERGGSGWTERYRLAYAGGLGMAEDDLFAPQVPVDPSLWRPGPVELNGEFTPDDEQRLTLAVRRPARLDEGVIDALAAVLAGQRRLEDAIGAAPLAEPVRAQLDVVGHLVAEARGPIRPVVVDVAQQWAQFSSWLHIATGDRAAAVALLDRTAEWAIEIGDMTMIGSVASWRSYLAEKAGRLGPMVGMAQAAQRYRSGSGRTYDLHLEARGHALMGDVRTAARVLGEAQEAAASLGPDDVRPWEYYYLAPGFFDLERGLVLGYMGRVERKHNPAAADAIATGLEALPEGMRAAEWTIPYRDAMRAAQERS